MPGTLGRGRQGREDGEPLREVGDGFRMGGALDGVLPRLVPIADRLGTETRLRAVLRQEFGLGSRGLGKLRLQHLGHTLMLPLPGAAQQRLVRNIADQGVFEEVGGLRVQPPLIQQFSRPLSGPIRVARWARLTGPRVWWSPPHRRASP